MSAAAEAGQGDAPAPVARLAGVSHRYGKRAALADVTLDVPAGVMAGLIGPDGVGKSTLLALVAGVRRIQAGAVDVLDGDMRRAGVRRARFARIAYMPQGLGRNLYPTLSVFENVDFFARLFGLKQAERRARIDELLAATGLAPFPDRPAGKLSGGMKQKLSLCCALVHEPDLLILDEPTTGVDPLSRRQFWELIGDMRARRPGMSVVVATAYMEEAERFDWLAAIDDGRVIASGSPAEVRAAAGQESLEAAFIALLPEAKRAGHAPVVVPPRRDGDGPPAIEAEHLTCRFGDFTAVDDVSFRIERGEIFGFLGSNGCGKSTTMKMLTGLLPATEGVAKLFGKAVDATDIETRRRVGYMSQSFSLYGELTVRQNLVLHAHLFHLPAREIDARIAELEARFGLADVADARPEGLPLGIRQRLQLAVAILHRPEILILDEPTSGVDPIARDDFWRELVALSRDDGVTIFVSTHFMNEAERCDRVSLMHAGRVLAVGAPPALAAERGHDSLEEAFVDYLAEAAGLAGGQGAAGAPPALAAERGHDSLEEAFVDYLAEASGLADGQGADVATAAAGTTATTAGEGGAPAPTVAAGTARAFDPRRIWAYARRETMEILRDPIRLAFALVGPMLLLLTFGFGISFDVERLGFAAFDQDRSPESRELIESFSSSRYFDQRGEIASAADLDARLQRGDIVVALEIPPSYGRDLVDGRTPEVAAWLDGAMPFRAETARGYVEGVAAQYLEEDLARAAAASGTTSPVTVVTRFRYNQSFESVYAMVPNVIMLMLVLIPAIMTAVGVVREKETGSIANFRSTPVTGIEFLLGKQLPYAATAFVSFLTLLLLALVVFAVPVRGSFATLVVGSALYVLATTAFGLVMSCFTSTQVAAVFATAIVTVLAAINFSGLLVPVSSLSGGARVAGLIFPAAWYQPVVIGTFTKALGAGALWPNLAVLAGFFVVFVAAARLALSKQER